MKILQVGMLVSAIAMTGCVPPHRNTIVTAQGPIHFEAYSLTAHKVTFDKGPIGVSNTFSVTDSISSYTRITWGHTELGKQKIEARWYRDGKQVFASGGWMEFNIDPFYFTFQVPASRIGVGKCRVDLFMDDQIIDHHEFEIQ